MCPPAASSISVMIGNDDERIFPLSQKCDAAAQMNISAQPMPRVPTAAIQGRFDREVERVPRAVHEKA